MKGFVILLLGIIFVTLIAGSVQSISADHLEPGIGIFKDNAWSVGPKSIGRF